MGKAEVLEQRKRVVQQELECWSAVREILKEKVVRQDAGGPSVLAYVQALEIAVNAEGRALEHIDAAYNAFVSNE